MIGQKTADQSRSVDSQEVLYHVIVNVSDFRREPASAAQMIEKTVEKLTTRSVQFADLAAEGTGFRTSTGPQSRHRSYPGLNL